MNSIFAEEEISVCGCGTASDWLMLIYLLEIKIVLNLKLTSPTHRQDLEEIKRRLPKNILITM